MLLLGYPKRPVWFWCHLIGLSSLFLYLFCFLWCLAALHVQNQLFDILMFLFGNNLAHFHYEDWESECVITPYMVSRYYRPPEICLGHRWAVFFFSVLQKCVLRVSDHSAYSRNSLNRSPNLIGPGILVTLPAHVQSRCALSELNVVDNAWLHFFSRPADKACLYWWFFTSFGMHIQCENALCNRGIFLCLEFLDSLLEAWRMCALLCVRAHYWGRHLFNALMGSLVRLGWQGCSFCANKASPPCAILVQGMTVTKQDPAR